jgi:hypothetical protein
MPDILGFRVEEALASLKEAGFDVVSQVITKPPRDAVPAMAEWRVIRQRQTGPHQVSLVIVFTPAWEKD